MAYGISSQTQVVLPPDVRKKLKYSYRNELLGRYGSATDAVVAERNRREREREQKIETDFQEKNLKLIEDQLEQSQEEAEQSQLLAEAGLGIAAYPHVKDLASKLPSKLGLSTGTTGGTAGVSSVSDITGLGPSGVFSGYGTGTSAGADIAGIGPGTGFEGATAGTGAGTGLSSTIGAWEAAGGPLAAFYTVAMDIENNGPISQGIERVFGEYGLGGFLSNVFGIGGKKIIDPAKKQYQFEDPLWGIKGDENYYALNRSIANPYDKYTNLYKKSRIEDLKRGMGLQYNTPEFENFIKNLQNINSNSPNSLDTIQSKFGINF